MDHTDNIVTVSAGAVALQIKNKKTKLALKPVHIQLLSQVFRNTFVSITDFDIVKWTKTITNQQ